MLIRDLSNYTVMRHSHIAFENVEEGYIDIRLLCYGYAQPFFRRPSLKTFRNFNELQQTTRFHHYRIDITVHILYK
jgi:hypothetical protein